MSVGLEFTKLNSERFVRVGEPIKAGYHSLPMDKILFQEGLYDFQKNNHFIDNNNEQYFSKKERGNDIICVQFSFIKDTVASFSLKVMDCDGTLTSVNTALYMNQKAVIGNLGGMPPEQLQTVVYNFYFKDVTGLTVGKKYLLLTVVGGDAITRQYISEPILVAEDWADTQKIEWNNYTNNYDTIFIGLPTNFNKRFDSIIKFKSNKVERTVFKNQKASQRGLYARSWRLYDFIIGSRPNDLGYIGINDRDVELISNVQKCDIFSIEGSRYIMDEAGDAEPTLIDEDYPLYQLTLQVADYNPMDRVEFYRASRIFLFDLGELPPSGLDGYPYAIDKLVMQDAKSGRLLDLLVDYPNGIKEVFDSTKQATFITELNAKGSTYGQLGSYIVDANKLYYQNADLEAWGVSSGDVSSLRTCFIIDVAATADINNAINIILDQLVGAATVVSVWESTLATNNIAPKHHNLGTENFTLNVPSTAANKIFIYCNNKTTNFEIYSSPTYKPIYLFSGAMSSQLTIFRASYGSLTSFNFGFLRYSSKELVVLNIQNYGFTTINTTVWASLTAGEWRYFNFLYLLNNGLTATGQDNLYNDYNTYILATYLASAPVGIINTSSQSPSSAPTAASLAARTNIASYAYPIFF